MKLPMRRFFPVLLGLMLAFAFYCVTVSAEESGIWGQLTWALDNDGLLMISGFGEMNDFDYWRSEAWRTSKSSIITVIIQPGVTSIGEDAFSFCSNLTSITIPESVTRIGSSAFCYASNLTNIIIPNSVTSIEYSTFSSCSNLTDFTIPDGVISIDNYAFSGCSGLTDITIPDSVTSIGYGAFYGCSGLTDISIPDSVTSIGERAFSDCSSLTSITIPDSVTSIGEAAFSDCNNLISITIPDSVTSIGNSAFQNCINLTGITIPDGVTSIGNSAFQNCISLTGITFPESVTSIGSYALSWCSSLTSITIPENVVSIGEGIFHNCSRLTSITIPDSVTSIGEEAFYGCSNLKNIKIPDTVTSIGESAFYGCNRLTNITIPDSVASIDSSTFPRDTIIYVNHIDSYAAKAVSKTSRSFRTPGGKYDLQYSFSSNNITGLQLSNADKDIESALIPNGVTKINNSAFFDCSHLTSIIIPDSVTSIGIDAFTNCSNLTSITIPGSVASIGEWAFCDCSSLTSIIIPVGVTSIGGGAFYNCSHLTSITIPASVKSIGSEAFLCCSRLEKVAFLHTEMSGRISFNSDIFTSAEVTVYCFMFSPVDVWATGQYPIVYLDEIDINTIRSIILPDDFKLPCGQSRELHYVLFPDDHSEVNWSSSDPQTVSVSSSGIVTAHRPGIASITATVGTVSQSVLVEAFTEATNFELSTSEVWLLAKDSLQLSAILFEPEGADADITWTSLDPSKATVDPDGLVTTVLPGDVIISADSQNGIHRECLLHLFYPITAVSFSAPYISVPMGGAYTLEANVTARTQSCINRLVTFASSDETVATVDEDGKVHGISLGTATITATSRNGKTASCTVTVRGAHILTLPAGTTVIESEAFAGLTDVDIIVLTAGVTFIADDAFEGSDVLVKAPAGSYAFQWALEHGMEAEPV